MGKKCDLRALFVLQKGTIFRSEKTGAQSLWGLICVEVSQRCNSVPFYLKKIVRIQHPSQLSEAREKNWRSKLQFFTAWPIPKFWWTNSANWHRVTFSVRCRANEASQTLCADFVQYEILHRFKEKKMQTLTQI